MIAIMRRRGAAVGWWSDIPRMLWDKLEGMENQLLLKANPGASHRAARAESVSSSPFVDK
jgi:hypothetical protein